MKVLQWLRRLWEPPDTGMTPEQRRAHDRLKELADRQQRLIFLQRERQIMTGDVKRRWDD